MMASFLFKESIHIKTFITPVKKVHSILFLKLACMYFDPILVFTYVSIVHNMYGMYVFVNVYLCVIFHAENITKQNDVLNT